MDCHQTEMWCSLLNCLQVQTLCYRLVPTELKELKIQSQELVDKGFSQPSTLLWKIPALFIRKKDGTLRICMDIR